MHNAITKREKIKRMAQLMMKSQLKQKTIYPYRLKEAYEKGRKACTDPDFEKRCECEEKEKGGESEEKEEDSECEEKESDLSAFVKRKELKTK